MAVVIPFPAHAPPDFPSLENRLPKPNFCDSTRVDLPLSAADREALLAALEIGLAAFAGNLGAVRRMVQAYAPVDLGPQLDALADRVFALGRRPDVWQTVIGSR